MFFFWALVILTAGLANLGMPFKILCQQTNATGDLKNVKSGDELDVAARNCPHLADMTEVNSSDSELNILSESTANDTRDLPIADDLPTETWKATWSKFRFVVNGIYIPAIVPLGIIGNAITLSVLRKDVLQSSSTIYLLGITVSDLVYVLILSPVALRAFDAIWLSRIMGSINSFRYSYILPFSSIAKTAAVWITISFTIERFVAVKWPLKAKEFSTKRRARTAVIGAYVFGCVLNVIRFFYRYPIRKVDPTTQEVYFDYDYTHIGRNETVNAVLFYAYLVFVEAIPFLLLAVLNSTIIWCVWQAQRRRLTMTGNNDTKVSSGKSRENQISMLMICMVIAHLVCNLCAGLASIWIAMNGRPALRTSQDPYKKYLLTLTNATLLSNPLANCILYVVCSSAMREGIKSQFCSRRKPKDKLNDQSKTSVVTETNRAGI